jgi:hypothetical protein
MKNSLLQKLEQMVECREAEPGPWRLAGTWQAAPANAPTAPAGAGFRAARNEGGARR